MQEDHKFVVSLKDKTKKMEAGGRGEREWEEKIGEEERKKFRQRENQSLKKSGIKIHWDALWWEKIRCFSS